MASSSAATASGSSQLGQQTPQRGAAKKSLTARIVCPGQTGDILNVLFRMHQRFPNGIETLQPLGGAMLVTFKSKHFFDVAIDAGILEVNGTDCTIVPVDGHIRWVTVMDLPAWVEWPALLTRLGEFGTVLDKEDVFYTGDQILAEKIRVKTGSRRVKVQLTSPATVIPNILQVNTHKVRVYYPGVVRLCFKCGQPGHMRKACPSVPVRQALASTGTPSGSASVKRRRYRKRKQSEHPSPSPIVSTVPVLVPPLAIEAGAATPATPVLVGEPPVSPMSSPVSPSPSKKRIREGITPLSPGCTSNVPPDTASSSSTGSNSSLETVIPVKTSSSLVGGGPPWPKPSYSSVAQAGTKSGNADPCYGSEFDIEDDFDEEDQYRGTDDVGFMAALKLAGNQHLSKVPDKMYYVDPEVKQFVTTNDDDDKLVFRPDVSVAWIDNYCTACYPSQVFEPASCQSGRCSGTSITKKGPPTASGSHLLFLVKGQERVLADFFVSRSCLRMGPHVFDPLYSDLLSSSESPYL